jgi:fido (protein-threonine AMPylation protein)
MLPGDWVSFSFCYTLDPLALAPAVSALAAYQSAAETPSLPKGWLAPAESPPESPAVAQPRDTSHALDWVRTRFRPGAAPLAVADLLTLHRLIAEQSGIEGGAAGMLRTGSVRVGRPLVGGFHFGAPAAKLPALLDEFVRFVDSAALTVEPPVIHALLAHFFCDTIHPFLDGNGRLSRLVAAAILSRRGYNLRGTWGLTRHFYRNSQHYHTILHEAWRRCPFELTRFLGFGIDGFVSELKSVDSFMKIKLERLIDQALAAPICRHRIGADHAAVRGVTHAA